MGYTPTEWNTGDVITAEKLNKIEEGIKDAPGYGYEEGVIFFEGELTTTGDYLNINFDPIRPITGDSIIVTLNGTEYELSQNEHGYGEETGSGPDFTNCPCYVATAEKIGSNLFYTSELGTYTVKISSFGENLVTTEDFEKAVESLLPPQEESKVKVITAVATASGGSYSVSCETTWLDVTTAFDEGKAILLLGIINPNDGTPESYWEKAVFTMSDYALNSLMNFESIYFYSNNSIITGIKVRQLQINLNSQWSYRESTGSFS